MRRVAQWSHDRRRLVAALWVLAIVGAGVLAGAVGGTFSNDFHLKGAESQQARDLLEQRYPQQAGDASRIVFRATSGTLRDAAQRARVERVVRSVQGLPSVVAVQSPFAGPGRGAVSRDGRTAFATVQFDQQANDLEVANTQRVIDTARAGATPDLQVNLGGQAIQEAQRPKQSATEAIGVVVAIIVLIFVLGSFGAMLMPLTVAFAAIIVATLLTTAATSVISIADFAPQLAVMIALGVGIDYALLIINRFRGEIAKGADVRAATLTSMDTAGRSVLFAGTTVVIALLGMLVLGFGFLNGPALAAALAVALTMVGSLTLLPALLGAFGHRIKPASLPDLDREPRGWARLSHLVERRPVVFAVAALALMLLIASPALGMHLGFSDAGNDSPDKTTRKAYDQLSEGFGPGFNGPFLLVAQPPANGSTAGLTRLRARLRAERGVAAVSRPRLNPAGDTATLQLFPTTQPQDPATQRLLERLRGTVIPPVAKAAAMPVSIGGATATQADLSAALTDKLPAFVLVVVGLSLLLLAVVFRSLLVPLKAGFLNILSIAGALGVITWVFQDGNLGSLIGVDTTGPVESFFPVFLFAIVFGLSMDYEVFLVTRMHEEWERTRDASFAVRHGLALTGRVITAAAIIMISVFASFMLGDDRVIKLFGLGLSAAVFFDAFVIRLFLVPSLMFLFGKASWWLPAWLDRRLPRISIEGPDDAHR